jgi:hypothetical protein
LLIIATEHFVFSRHFIWSRLSGVLVLDVLQYQRRTGVYMDMNERQIALSVLESIRGDLMYAHLNNGSRVLDVADLRQYIYEQISGDDE